MPRKKTNSKSKGRPNAFSEEKLAFLESYGDEWLTSTDRTALYTLITKRFLLKFGYDLELNKNPPEGYVVNVEIDPSLSVEARLEESTRRDALYKVLRAVSIFLRTYKHARLTYEPRNWGTGIDTSTRIRTQIRRSSTKLSIKFLQLRHLVLEKNRQSRFTPAFTKKKNLNLNLMPSGRLFKIPSMPRTV